MAIPKELLLLRQWVVADPKNKIPLSARTGKPVSCHESGDWVTAAELPKMSKDLVWGLVLTENDPYVCIDIDYKHFKQAPARYRQLMELSGSYVELSASGKGYHIWVKGKIPHAVKKDIEIYAKERYIIMTGCAYQDKPIIRAQKYLNRIFEKYTQPVESSYNYTLNKIVGEFEDDLVIKKAIGAANGEKFSNLYYCRNVHNNSEDDAALIEMLCFHTKSDEQAWRIFKSSELYRPKHDRRPDLFIRALSASRGRIAAQDKLADSIMGKMPESITKPTIGGNLIDFDTMPAQMIRAKLSKIEIDWPPGKFGDLAKEFYHRSYKPIKEVSICTALGILSGICGKAWNVNRLGLNGYYILIGRSGVGKDALFECSQSLLHQMRLNNLSFIHDFINEDDYVSPQALTKSLAGNQCFVNFSSEIGKRIQTMTQKNPPQHLRDYASLLTRLYTRSKRGAAIGNLVYSNNEGNTNIPKGAIAFSLVGETTPGTFYQNITDEVLEDGFLSRFLLIEYHGDSPDSNAVDIQPYPLSLMQHLNEMSKKAKELNMVNNPQDVTFTRMAEKEFQAFGLYCNGKIAGVECEKVRQKWVRAVEKAYKVAGLLAVMDDFDSPVVTGEMAVWSKELILKGIINFDAKDSNGMVGLATDNTREFTMTKLIEEMLRGGRKSKELGTLEQRLMGSHCITYRKLQQSLANYAEFKNYNANGGGSTRAIKDTIQLLVDKGTLWEVPTVNDIRQGYTGKLYKIM
jgi:hypothetical protein